MGARRLALEGNAGTSGLNAVEGAVFALMGLFLAFSMNGALQRFDERRLLILQEANAISTAYDRLDILMETARPQLKSKLKEYLRTRMALYEKPLEFSLATNAVKFDASQLSRLAVLKSELWQSAAASCPASAATASACMLVLPSLNSAFEAARLRFGAIERHPPTIVYIMLFGLGLAGSLLAGLRNGSK